MKFNLKDIYCVDLTKYTEYQVFVIQEELGYKGLLEAKREGVLKIFFNEEDKSSVAYIINNNKYSNYKGFAPCEKYSGHITKHQRKYMMNMDSYEFNILEESLVVDDILDKILEYGIDSISTGEKDFLDNFGN
jgi:hypothetical protein